MTLYHWIKVGTSARCYTCHYMPSSHWLHKKYINSEHKEEWNAKCTQQHIEYVVYNFSDRKYSPFAFIVESEFFVCESSFALLLFILFWIVFIFYPYIFWLDCAQHFKISMELCRASICIASSESSMHISLVLHLDSC